MELIVDLHIHSRYSRATSQHMTPENLYRWGKIKGIQVMGTSDFTHPLWLKELREKLEPAEPGLFKLKDNLAFQQDQLLSESCRKNLHRFILTVEISNIYSKAGRVRKLHNLVIVPSFEVAGKLVSQLERIGNLKADGRPILGMDSKHLLELSLEADPQSLFIPAHIWTPWFAVFGSKSGFDSLEEAFGELAPQVRAVETGLSSDPAMNWRLSQLDEITLVSNSDAHSPEKLGREANVMECELNYLDIIEGIRKGDKRFIGTIEFFPEEGKYHYDGHRTCGVRLAPAETKKLGGVCPKCNLPLVVGVQYRVDELADRPLGFSPKSAKKVEYIVPLSEMIAETEHTKSTSSKKVRTVYEHAIEALGDEFKILRHVPIDQIEHSGFTRLSEAIRRMRDRQVQIEPGYDGVYGVVRLFDSPQEVEHLAGQLAMKL